MRVKAPPVRLPRPSDVEAGKLALSQALGISKVDDSPEGRERLAHDESETERHLPDVVVTATSAEDVRRVLEIAQQHDLPVTPRAAGTGRTGGSVPVAGGVLLSIEKLASVKEIDRENLIAVVEPGVVLGPFQAMVENEGLFYPPDPNSAEWCMIGGNLAENAGGPRAFKYGVTSHYVLGLEVALMGGRLLRTGKRTVKGVTGYDVTSLLVGSEGTLGVFTEATLRLVPKPQSVATLLAICADVHAAGRAVAALIAKGQVPRCLELMDSLTLEAVKKDVAVDPRAGAMLLIEIDGDEPAVEASMETIGGVLSEVDGVIDVLAAQDASQRERLWSARKALSRATRKLAKYKLSEDIVVPRSRVPALLAEVDRIGERERVRHLAYGHAGDGNLHVNFLWDDDQESSRVLRAIEALMRATVSLGGTLSGEHGIGISKAEYLGLEQSDDLIQLQRDLKTVFDPRGLMNPGKIFPTPGHRAC